MDDSADWKPWGIPLIVIGCIILVVLVLFLVRRWIRGPMYKGKVRIEGKTVLVTGGNTGCGKETARDLAKRGGKVILLCRNMTKAKAAADEISKETGAYVGYYELDLSSLESVRNCVELLKEKEPKIDILINNAGIMACPRWETKDGFEMQFGTNHLGHFLLTALLMDNIKAAAPSRIINLASIAHRGGVMHWDDINLKKNYTAPSEHLDKTFHLDCTLFNIPVFYQGTPLFSSVFSMEGGVMHWDDINLKKNYTPVGAYTQSKVANILFTKSLAKKFTDDGVISYAVHPGVVHTELAEHLRESYGSCFSVFYDHLNWIFMKTPLLGAQTTIYCAVDEELAKHSGKYYSDCHAIQPASNALMRKVQRGFGI